MSKEASITCVVSGTAAASGASTAQPLPEGVFAQLEGNGVGKENAWMAAHVTLMTDGTFSVVIDYGADHAGNQTDSGTWTEAEDGSLTLAGDKRELTAQATDNGDGTTTYTIEFVNTETNITCAVSGIVSG